MILPLDIPPPTEIYSEIVWDAFVNVEGGVKKGSAHIYVANLGIQHHVTPALKINAALWLTSDNTFSNLVGDEQVISNIESGTQSLRLGQFNFEYSSQYYSLLAGVYDLNSEFDALESANLFINSAHGLGTDIGQSGNNGPSIFPTPGLAMRAKYKLTHHSFKFAILDGTPGNPEIPDSQSLQLDLDKDALMVGEYAYKDRLINVLAGVWRYTTEQSYVDSNTLKGDDNGGFYLRGEWTVIENSNEQDLIIFARWGSANGHYNKYSRFYSLGFNSPSPLASRSDDRWGIAIAQAKVAKGLNDASIADSETNIELTYLANFNTQFSLQPNIQYVVSPSAETNIANALVIGLRATISLY